MSDNFDNVLRLLQIGTICFGSICVFMSMMLFIHFIRSPRKIGKAVALMLLGEAVGSTVVVIFSIAANGPLDVLTPIECLALRWVMFSVATVTSIHLAYRTWMIEVGADD